MKRENPEAILSEMFKSIRDFFTMIGVFAVMLATLGYYWGYLG